MVIYSIRSTINMYYGQYRSMKILYWRVSAKEGSQKHNFNGKLEFWFKNVTSVTATSITNITEIYETCENLCEKKLMGNKNLRTRWQNFVW
jgi:hypothetical protein